MEFNVRSRLGKSPNVSSTKKISTTGKDPRSASAAAYVVNGLPPLDCDVSYRPASLFPIRFTPLQVFSTAFVSLKLGELPKRICRFFSVPLSFSPTERRGDPPPLPPAFDVKMEFRTVN